MIRDYILKNGPTKMYSYAHGIVDVECSDARFGKGAHLGKLDVYRDGVLVASFWSSGAFYKNDKYRTLLFLEEAEADGLVTKTYSTKEKHRVKFSYQSLAADRRTIIGVTSGFYDNRADFELCYPSEHKFICFVDDHLNECPPPGKEFEWKEVPKVSYIPNSI